MAAEMVTVVSSVNASLILICFNKTALLGFGSYLCHSVTDIQNICVVVLQVLTCSHILFTSFSSSHLHGNICKNGTGMVEVK